jgi:sulfonate transport system substrate-binding protein
MRNQTSDKETKLDAFIRPPNATKSGLGALLWISLFVALFAILLVCGRSFGTEETLKVIRIGYQKYGSFSIVKARHTLDDQLAKRAIKIDWILFPAGPQLLEAMNAGAIDLGHTGEAPPIFAQAANNPFVYIGNQRPTLRARQFLSPITLLSNPLPISKGRRLP